ncbi:MAG: hypothetical protein AB2A00_10965 [Myxococcota bacterium]
MPRRPTTPVSTEWTPRERQVLQRLRTPEHIQAWLDETPYSTEPIYRSPRTVMRDRRAHCFDGAVLAAAAFREHGGRALILDMRAHRDDDHVLAVYQQDGCWGAVAKSNFVGLRARQPIYRNLRELVLTYFELYYNMDGERALRSFSPAIDLDRVGHPTWRVEDRCMKHIAAHLDRAPHEPLMKPAQVRKLTRVDKLTYQANMLGVDLDGVYWPSGKKRVAPPKLS